MPNKKMVQIGKEFFDTDQGILDNQGQPITYCPVCSAQYTDVDIYHRMKSAIYR